MQIHTTRKNETTADVAREYGVDAEILREYNGLDGDEPIEGEELLILQPTRTYTVAEGDSVERLALRFGVRRSELIAHNPEIIRRGLRPGMKLAIRYGEPSHGMAPSNGYFYPTCKRERLDLALPYLTYVTFAAAADNGRHTVETFNAERVVRYVTERGKIPLVRIYDRADERTLRGDDMRDYAKRMVEYAVKGGYRGIVLPPPRREVNEDGYAEFLIELRREMLGCDLILVTEVCEPICRAAAEYADASIFDYSKLEKEAPPCFAEGEARAMSDYATRHESTKTFVSLPTFARGERGYKEIRELLGEARRVGGRVSVDDSTMLARLETRGGEWCYPSLKNTKAILDCISEYGFMGISFDCMRVPRAHLAMYNASYKTSGAPSVQSTVRCNPD